MERVWNCPKGGKEWSLFFLHPRLDLIGCKYESKGMTLGEPAAVLEGLNYETLD